MKKIMMQGKKDCMNTCLSMLLDIPYEEIPFFFEDEAGFYPSYSSWLLEKGLQFFYIELDPRKIPIRMSSVGYCLGTLRKQDRAYDHAVILKYGERSIEIYHDPKPNTDYTIDDLIGFEFIFPLQEVKS